VLISTARRTAIFLAAAALAAFAATPPAEGRLYAPTSPFNRAIPAFPAIDPASEQMVQTLVAAAQARGFVVAAHEWTVPVYYADAGTPRYDVRTAGQPPGAHYDRSFVPDVQRVMRDVPIPDGAAPDPQEDGHMTVIDESAGCEYDLYAATKRGDSWSALWGSRISTLSNGIYPRGLSTRGTGFAPLAGLIWPEELRAGRIDHALLFAYPTTRAGGPVGPATASDGKTVRPDAIPQGARVQLDPELDLEALELAPYEKTIARALQEYGMLLGDTGGVLGLYAVGAQSFAGLPYQGLLADDMYTFLDRIPVSRFRVLETGPQRPHTPLSVTGSHCASIQRLW
jgi:hypothetical protein